LISGRVKGRLSELFERHLVTLSSSFAFLAGFSHVCVDV
jgi:hypothetical protein